MKWVMDSPRAGIAPPGFRLPDDAAVGLVTLQIADLDRSLRFYRDLIGLRVLDRTSHDGMGLAKLGAQGTTRPLLELREKPGLRPVPRRGLLGLYHFALLLPDRPSLGSFFRHVTQAGVYPGAADHLVSEALYLTDPDGLVIEVYRDRPRQEWRLHDQEYAMASDPLDTPGLLREAGATRWAGVPPGSRVGHMHFYVGDLGAAESFYHVGLGLDKMVWSYPGALFLAAGGYHHHVGTNTWAAGSPAATPDDAGLLSWELVLPDATSVRQAAGSMIEAGYSVGEVDGRLQVTDPWGITAHITAK